eukprot:scaffold248391_cov70-Cyclotella_meneghiniana.AAC.9
MIWLSAVAYAKFQFYQLELAYLVVCDDLPATNSLTAEDTRSMDKSSGYYGRGWLKTATRRLSRTSRTTRGELDVMFRGRILFACQ